MNIQIIYGDTSPCLRSEARNLSALEVTELWAAGHSIAAVADPKFVSADFVCVLVRSAFNELAQYLGHAYTQTHACAAAISQEGELDPILLLLFELPKPIDKASSYKQILAGLNGLYPKSRAALDPGQVYGGKQGLKSQVLNGALTVSDVSALTQIGFEQLAIRANKGQFQRANAVVEVDDVLVDQQGMGFLVHEVPDGHLVHCPQHLGFEASAEAVTLDNGSRGLVCHVCRRAFATSHAQPGYMFGKLEATLRTLHAEHSDKGQFSFLEECYLPKGLIDSNGIYFIKSPKGSGKTEILHEVIKAAKAEQKAVLLLGHRRTLLQSMTERLGIDCYLVPDTDGSPTPEVFEYEEQDGTQLRAMPSDFEAVRVPATKYFGVCLDSSTALEPARDKYEVLIIDECEQVFAHLVGKTLKDRRHAVYLRLAHYLKVAEKVVLLDADLGMITVRTVLGIDLKPDARLQFIVNQPSTAASAVQLYEDRGQLVTEMKSVVADGHKVFVATNSKKKAVELEKMLQDIHPQKRIIAIHSDNAQRAEVQRMLKDMAGEFERDLDVLIASPAMGTGIDISFRNQDNTPRTVVQHVFGFFVGNVTTHFDIDQQLYRVRHPGKVHVWVDDREMSYEADPHAIRAELKKTIGQDLQLLGYQDDGTAILSGDDSLLDIWAEVKAVQRGSKNQLCVSFQQLRRSNLSPVFPVKHDELSSKTGRDALKGARERRITDNAKAVAKAKDLDPKERNRLKRRLDDGLPLTPDQQAQLDKSDLAVFYLAEVDEELVLFDDDAKTRQAVRNLEVLLADENELKRREVERVHEIYSAKRTMAGHIKLNARPLPSDLSMLMSRRAILRSVLAASGLFCAGELNAHVQIHQHRLDRFVSELNRYKEQFSVLFELPLRADCHDKPMRQLTEILKLLGLKLSLAETKDVGRKKLRSYALDTDCLQKLMAVVDRRAEDRETRSEAAAENWRVDFKAKGRARRSAFADQIARWAGGGACGSTATRQPDSTPTDGEG